MGVGPGLDAGFLSFGPALAGPEHANAVSAARTAGGHRVIRIFIVGAYCTRHRADQIISGSFQVPRPRVVTVFLALGSCRPYG